MMKNDFVSQKGKIWLKRELRPYRAFIFFLAVLSVTATLFSLAFAYLVKFLINGARDQDKSRLILFSAVLLGVLLLKILLQVVNGYLSEMARAKINSNLRTNLFSKILRADYKKIQEYHSGELLTRLTSDVQEVAVDSVGLLASVASMVVQCLGAIVALMTIDPLFTGIYVVSGCVFVGLSALFRKRIKKVQREFLEADGSSRSFMQEGISSVLTLKAYSAEEKTTKKASYFARKYYLTRMKRNRLRSGMSAIFSLLSNMGMIFAVVWCSVSVFLGNDDYGSILSVILLLMQLQHPLSSFSGVLPVYYARITSGERLAEIDELATERVEYLDGKNVYEKMLGVELKDVTFNYGRESVLMNANAFFHKGEIICITGASGSGKSTLFRLLLKVFVPENGNVCLRLLDDEMEITESHRALFAYVPQGNFLFSGTIYENLTFFAGEQPEAELNERLKKAIKTACAEFVYDLPDGLNTPLYERGAGLSEGQLQRLAVARALVSDRPILLLDEATSALDSETEKNMLENIKNMQNKTCIIVTHRPAALAIADSVYCVEKGKILKTNKS